MSQINEFARDLVKRQIQIYKENKSEKFDMTQPLSVLICCSIIIFSDYMEHSNEDSLIKEIKKNDNNEALIAFIKGIYSGNFEKRLELYRKDRLKNGKTNFINNDLKEYEVFFHDLRNEFAHIIETNKSRLSPNDGDFNEITIEAGKNKITIKKSQLNELIKIIDEKLPKTTQSSCLNP